MASTFFGLTIASSGLSAYQTAINTTANNISNVDTEGYTRQQVVLQAAESLRVAAKYGVTGSGVEVTDIQQCRNEYYDMKYWNANSTYSEFDQKSYYLEQMEQFFVDDSTVSGFATIFSKMFNTLNTLETYPSDLTKRNAYISDALSLTNYFNSVSSELSDLQYEINQQMSTYVDEVNAVAQKIATLNKQINVIEQQGGTALELRDERNLLMDELSGIVPVEATELDIPNDNGVYTGATSYTVKINGQTLVSNYEYNTLECVARQTKNNQSDVEGLYDIYWVGTSNKLELNTSSMSGTLKALFDVRDGNNGENFKGTISSVQVGLSGSLVTVSDPNITDISQVTMPEEGTISLNNKEYVYTGYTLYQKNDGSYYYEFKLAEFVTAMDTARCVGKQASIGEDVDTMGIAYYQSQLNEFVRSFTSQYNDMILDNEGVDKNGELAGVFFVADDKVNGGEYMYSEEESANVVFRASSADVSTSSYYYLLTAANLSVADEVQEDPNRMSTVSKEEYHQGADAGADLSELVESLSKLYDEIELFRGGVGRDFLQCIISDISVDTQEAEIFRDAYKNMLSTIDDTRKSDSGVDEDEEALNLVEYQNAYNLSAKVVSVIQEMLDQLILNTAV